MSSTNFLRSRYQEVRALAKSLLQQHGLEDNWHFRGDQAKTRIGVCNYTKRTISLSVYFMTMESVTMDKIKVALLNIIARALIGADHDDEEWKAKALLIGGDGNNSYKGPPIADFKYCYQCPNHPDTMFINRHKKVRRGYSFKCTSCSTKLVCHRRKNCRSLHLTRRR